MFKKHYYTEILMHFTVFKALTSFAEKCLFKILLYHAYLYTYTPYFFVCFWGLQKRRCPLGQCCSPCVVAPGIWVTRVWQWDSLPLRHKIKALVLGDNFSEIMIYLPSAMSLFRVVFHILYSRGFYLSHGSMYIGSFLMVYSGQLSFISCQIIFMG